MLFTNWARLYLHDYVLVQLISLATSSFTSKNMYIGDINLFIIVFIVILSSICINVSSALHLLLTAEILWITLYFLTLSLGVSYDNINLLSLTFLFLVLSAVEFGIGLVLLLIQNIFFRSLSLIDSSSDFLKNSTRFNSRLKSNFIPFL